MMYDWNDLAFASKKPIKDLKATFVAAPREISAKRFMQLIKEYLPKGHIVLGLAREAYIDGFEDQPQFRTLTIKTVEKLVKKVNDSGSKHKIQVLNYFQRDWVSVISKLNFSRVLLINGSWKYVFHNSPLYYLLTKEEIPYQLISPFSDEAEAKLYERKTKAIIDDAVATHYKSSATQSFSATEMLGHANYIAKSSFDYNFQTGASLGIKEPGKQAYTFLGVASNKVVPFETYALHNGSAREMHFSPSNDLNYYDAVHAEVELLLTALKHGFKLSHTSLFINLLPCPTCARMICDTEIREIVYQNDHSDGYAVKLLEKAGKTVRRLVI